MSGVPRFGHTELPEEQQRALRKAIRLEVATLVFMVTAIAAVMAVMGSSQAMKAAWIEDMLALIPPLAFLIAIRRARRPPTPDHPYGYHRSVAIGHLTAAVALLSMGLFLIEDSARGLILLEHPPVGTLQLFGHTFWAGWAMIAVMVYTGIGPAILGRLKLPVAEQLHDKVLYADADMQKADWRTASGTIVGVTGIGLGLWWLDATVALLIALSIVHDGWRNLRYAAGALRDQRARTFDDKQPHPLTREVDERLRTLPWVADARTRMRDQGHVFHVESFVVGRDGDPTLDQVEQAVSVIDGMDWKLHDIVVMPVRRLPETIPDPTLPD